MFYFLTFIGLALAALSWAASQKRRNMREIQAMFVRYNDTQDLTVITNWIGETTSGQRLAATLEYLEKIEMENLAADVIAAVGMDRDSSRYARVLAVKAFKRTGDETRGLKFATELLEDFPGDDSILDLVIDAYLHFEALDDASALLLPRLERKYEGTILARHHARLLALQGHYDQAVTIMQKVKDRDYNLYRNTFAQPQKRLIFDQYEESCRFLESFQAKLNGGSGQTS